MLVYERTEVSALYTVDLFLLAAFKVCIYKNRHFLQINVLQELMYPPPHFHPGMPVDVNK